MRIHLEYRVSCKDVKAACKALLLTVIIAWSTQAFSQKKTVYLIPGIGMDASVFDQFSFDSTRVNPIRLEWIEPEERESLAHYSQRLSEQMNLEKPFSIIGVSTGGMIAKEICKIQPAEYVVLISSAQRKKEVAGRFRRAKFLSKYRSMSNDELYEYIYSTEAKKENTGSAEEEPALRMFHKLSNDFIQWQLYSMLHWKSGKEAIRSNSVTIIHGAKDEVVPMKNLTEQPQAIIEKGSHNIAVNHAEKLNLIINVEFLRG